MTAASPPALLQRAIQFHQRGQLPDAEQLYRSVLAEDAGNFDAQYLLAMLYMQQGRAEQALRYADGAAKANPASADALLLLGSALLTVGRTGEAVAAFD